MNILLIFFALPLAVIIFSIALQKILKCPAIVASIIFAVSLIITFVLNNLNYLIATIIYTIISFITAIIVNIICKTYNCGCCNQNDEELLEISNIDDNNCNVQQCNCMRNLDNNTSYTKVNFVPNCRYKNYRRK